MARVLSKEDVFAIILLLLVKEDDVAEGVDRFHWRHPSTSISACIQPHSMIFFSSHSKLTGLVKKSLHPADRAACRSDSCEEAVKATIITGDWNVTAVGFVVTVEDVFVGDRFDAGLSFGLLLSVVGDADGSGGIECASGLSSLLSSFERAFVTSHLLGKTPIFFSFSILRIILVASIPLITGNWISIYTVRNQYTDCLFCLHCALTKIRWKPPFFHFSTACFPSLETSYLISCFFIHVDKIAWLIMLSMKRLSWLDIEFSSYAIPIPYLLQSTL